MINHWILAYHTLRQSHMLFDPHVSIHLTGSYRGVSYQKKIKVIKKKFNFPSKKNKLIKKKYSLISWPAQAKRKIQAS